MNNLLLSDNAAVLSFWLRFMHMGGTKFKMKGPLLTWDRQGHLEKPAHCLLVCITSVLGLGLNHRQQGQSALLLPARAP